MECIFVLPRNIRSISMLFKSLGGKARMRGHLVMIWHYVILSIWKSRNSIFFAGSSTTIKDVEAKIIFLEWNWHLGTHA